MLNDRHVCIVGAGPSLDDALAQLKKYQNRRELAVIAVDMALLPLVRSGIRPGFVISCETTPVDFFGEADTAGMHLLAFTCMSRVTKWRGDISFYNWMVGGAVTTRSGTRQERHRGRERAMSYRRWPSLGCRIGRFSSRVTSRSGEDAMQGTVSHEALRGGSEVLPGRVRKWAIAGG